MHPGRDHEERAVREQEHLFIGEENRPDHEVRGRHAYVASPSTTISRQSGTGSGTASIRYVASPASAPLRFQNLPQRLDRLL